MKDGAVYEDMMDFKALKKLMEEKLEDYNMEPGVIGMNLVLFRDAIEHGTVASSTDISRQKAQRHDTYHTMHERLDTPYSPDLTWHVTRRYIMMSGHVAHASCHFTSHNVENEAEN